MKVRLLRPWLSWSAGHVFTDMPGGQARTLIARGHAEAVEATDRRGMSSPVDRMMRRRATRAAANPRQGVLT